MTKKRPGDDDIEIEKSFNKRCRTDDDSLFDEEEKMDDDDKNEVIDKIENILKLPQDQIINEIKSLIKSILNTQSLNKLCQIFYSLVEYITNTKDLENNLDDKIITQIILTLIYQIEFLPFLIIKKTISLFLTRIKQQKPFNEKCLQLFIDILNYIQSISPKWASEENESGYEYIQSFIEELLSYTWIQPTAINILFVLKHIKLEFQQLKKLVLKLFNFEEISWSTNQIPSLINNILYFMPINKDFRNFLYEKIFLFFNDLRKTIISKTNALQQKTITTATEFAHPSSSLLSSTTINFSQKSDYIDAEILSIMHILHSIKTDRAVARDLVKLLKTKLTKNVKEVFYPFTFALSLALVKILPKQDGIIDILKNSIEKIYEAELKAKQYSWVFKGLNDDEKNFSKTLLKPSKCKILASEAVLEGLIDFLFCLLDTNGVRMTKSMKAISLKEYVTFYASDILNDLFKNFPVSREEILNQLTEQIFANNTTKSFVYIDQLTILINSQPPSQFQEYFRRFKGKLDHLINLTPTVALELFNSIKPLFRYDSIYKDNLIITLKKSIFQSDVDIRKVGVCGLISLLTTTKLNVFLPASQASQSMSLSQSQSQMSRVTASQEKCIETSCLEIFFSLRRCLTQQVEIRSILYQSCFNLVSQNITLIGPTLNLLLTKLDEYLIFDDSGILIDLKKCFFIDDKNQFNMIEPIDILIHAATMCNMKFVEFDSQSKLNDVDEDIKKHSEDLKMYLEQIKETFFKESVKNTFDLYKKEINTYYSSQFNESLTTNIIKPTNTVGTQKTNDIKKLSAQQLFLPFQCLLGVLEVLMEYHFLCNEYDATYKIFKYYNELFKYVEKDLNEVTKPPSKPKKTKKQKENINPNEDEIMDMDTEEQQDVANTTKQNETIKKSNRNTNSNTKFSYNYRLSYTSTLNLFQIIYKGSSTIKNEDETDIENFLFQIKDNIDEFKLYLLNVLTQQLDNLINTKSNIYDIESYDQKNLLKYLLSIWKILWNEMNETKCSNNECTNENFYCAKCIQYRSSYIKCLINIWNIVSLKFNSKLNDLFSVEVFNSEEEISGTNESNHSVIAVGLLDMCRKYIEKSLNSERQNLTNSFKLCSSLLDLMTDIANTIQIQINDYSVLFQWTQTLATQEFANDPLFSKSLLKFFIFVTWNKNSSAALMKYLCTDVLHFFDTYNKDHEVEPAVFNFLSEKNSTIILNIIFEEELNILNSFEWFLSYKAKFENSQETIAFYKQILCLMQSLNSLIVANLPVGQAHENLIRVIIKFYNFMISMSKHICDREINETEEKFFKQLVDFCAKKLQASIRSFITLLQNIKPSDSKLKQKVGKVDKGKELKEGKKMYEISSTKLLKCTKLIPQLVYVIEQYEQQLRSLNKKFNSTINLMENFQAYIRDFKIKLPKNMPITQQQVNENYNDEESNDISTTNTAVDSNINEGGDENNNDDDDDEDEEDEE